MLALLGLAIALFLVIAFIKAEIRSAWPEMTLSNGVEVLVNPEMHREIVRRFRMSDDPDSGNPECSSDGAPSRMGISGSLT
jgi:hypothetical protein